MYPSNVYNAILTAYAYVGVIKGVLSIQMNYDLENTAAVVNLTNKPVQLKI